MSKVYDNWERLVAATLKKQAYRELALAVSRETSFSSSSASLPVSPRTRSPFTFKSFHTSSGVIVGRRNSSLGIAKAIRLAEQVAYTPSAGPFTREGRKLMDKARQLVLLLKRVESVSDTIYDRPTSRIVHDTEQILSRAVGLVRRSGSRREHADIVRKDFTTATSLLEQSAGNIEWLLSGGEYLGIPPIAAGEPTLCHVWELIAILRTGSPDDRSDAAAALSSLARDDGLYRKLIVEEGGSQSLFRFMKEGKPEGKEIAENLIRFLAKYSPHGLLKKDPLKLCHILEMISVLDSGGDPSYAAAALVELAREDNAYRRFMVQEGAVEGLMGLLGEGKRKWKETAARTIQLLATSPGEIEEWFGVLDTR